MLADAHANGRFVFSPQLASRAFQACSARVGLESTWQVESCDAPSQMIRGWVASHLEHEVGKEPRALCTIPTTVSHHLSMYGMEKHCADRSANDTVRSSTKVDHICAKND
eukprot:930125-Pleurochrysis_carterae.AAC.1